MPTDRVIPQAGRANVALPAFRGGNTLAGGLADLAKALNPTRGPLAGLLQDRRHRGVQLQRVLPPGLRKLRLPIHR